MRTTSAPSVGRGVATVEEAVDGDVRHLEPHAQLDAGEQVAVERVHATGAEQPDQVQRAAGLPEPGAELLQHRQLVELAPLDALRDAHEILRHHAPGAEVEVAHLAVAHLADGEPDGESARVEQRAGVAVPEPLPGGRVRERDGIALALGPVAPPVEHHEHDRSAMPDVV